MIEAWREAVLYQRSSIKDALKKLDALELKLVILIDDEGMLLGTVSDGDIRRGMIDGKSINGPALEIANTTPLVATEDTNKIQLFDLMQLHKISVVPILDNDFKVIGLYREKPEDKFVLRKNKFVIMAGGKGKRMMPFTEICPKPLIQISNKPILQHIIERAKSEGFINFYLLTNYLSSMIKDYFGDGSKLGVNINYIEEKFPLGTAGGLSNIEVLKDDEPLIVSNGDVMCDINYADLLKYHLNHKVEATMAVKSYELQNPFGVVKTQNGFITGIEEKPVIKSNINAGIYVLNSSSISLIIKDEYCDMPTLFKNIISDGGLTIAYPIHEPWLDVGRPEDIETAVNFINRGGIKNE
jgi:dTDP-glucose pyrophosphorylase